MEKVDACISKEWRRRMLFMLFMVSCIAGWFLYDGYSVWPSEAERHAEFIEIEDALIASGKIEAQPKKAHGGEVNEYLRIEWERHAREVGYKRDIPKERTDASIREQRMIGWVMMTGSAIFGLWVLWNHKLRVQTEGDVVIGTAGQRVELDSIIAIDRKKWKNKGIAYAIYEAGGKERRLCLDDHKFKGCEAIILEAEKRIKARTGEGAET
ncbi:MULTISPECIES: hypothetical protein [unclassified Lentimonas]|uniref:hypothetical protein n=1 Tax=unclassified Lentimonas TaxID=2630993 RepID=UPI001389C9E3|nr:MULTISPECIES: hypothetical protein [unclassified Lentimonas]